MIGRLFLQYKQVLVVYKREFSIMNTSYVLSVLLTNTHKSINSTTREENKRQDESSSLASSTIDNCLLCLMKLSSCGPILKWWSIYYAMPVCH